MIPWPHSLSPEPCNVDYAGDVGENPTEAACQFSSAVEHQHSNMLKVDGSSPSAGIILP